MPLHRVFREPMIAADKAAVMFHMAEGVELFRCLAPFSTLDALRGHVGVSDWEALQTFRLHRERIELVASRMHDAAQSRSDGFIVVTAADLIGTPQG